MRGLAGLATTDEFCAAPRIDLAKRPSKLRKSPGGAWAVFSVPTGLPCLSSHDFTLQWLLLRLSVFLQGLQLLEATKALANFTSRFWKARRVFLEFSPLFCPSFTCTCIHHWPSTRSSPYLRTNPLPWTTARNIKGLDKNGVSDPMVEVYIGNVRRSPLSTKVYNKTVNPQVRESLWKACFITSWKHYFPSC